MIADFLDRCQPRAFPSGHDEKEWDRLFGAIADIKGVSDMKKCVLLPDEEEALRKSFNKSKIPHKTTDATCSIHSEWKMAKKKMANGSTFGRRLGLGFKFNGHTLDTHV